MSIEQIKPLLIDFVNRNFGLVNVSGILLFLCLCILTLFLLLVRIKSRLLIIFLLVASITESRLVGPAENARAILTYLPDFVLSS